jgi:Ca2+-binding RTX toxin-like protein
MAVIQFFGPFNMSTSQTTAGNMTGATATQLTITDGYNTSIYGGNFTYSNNQVFGTLTDYQQLQGSALLVQATGLNIDAHYAASLIQSNQVQTLYQAILQGNDILIGANTGGDVLTGFSGNDVYVLKGGSNTVLGGNGFNTVVINTPIASATETLTGNVETLHIGSSTNTLTNVSRIQFSDNVLALDVQGNAGNAYRLYQAAFNRTPDNEVVPVV